jgi:hypothetical protein
MSTIIAPVGGVPKPLEIQPQPKVVVDQTPDLVHQLEEQLRMNQQHYERMDAYYRGQHSTSMFSSTEFQQAFGRQLSSFADNWLRLVINVTNNRLKVEGFRVGSGVDTDLVDQTAWKVWRANRLSRGSRVAHRDAMKFGTSFILVDPFGPDGSPLQASATPRVTVESPYQVVGIHRPDDRTALVAAIKKWVGSDGYLYLNYYLPDVVQKFRSAAPSQELNRQSQIGLLQPASWQLLGEVENPLGEVPIVPIENEPDPIVGGESDLSDLIPLNDALNKTIRDSLIGSEYEGFRQRIITGVDVPRDPETGKSLAEDQIALVASASRTWMIPNADAKFYEGGEINLTSQMALVDTLIHHISEISQTPGYLLVGKLSNLSADAIRAAELGFVAKLEGKQEDYAASWERALGLVFAAMKQPQEDGTIETIWKDAASNSGSVLANELNLMAALGVPQQALLEKYGYSPMTIARWEKQGLLGPVAANPTVSPPGTPVSSSTSRVSAGDPLNLGASNSAPDG